MSETQRWLLREQLHKVENLDEAVVRLDVKIAELCLPFAQALSVMDQIPGINQRIADKLVQRLRKLGYAVEVSVAEPAA